MKLVTESYLTQISRLPKTGCHIVAQYDNESIVVYQAYCVTSPTLNRDGYSVGFQQPDEGYEGFPSWYYRP